MLCYIYIYICIYVYEKNNACKVLTNELMFPYQKK